MTHRLAKILLLVAFSLGLAGVLNPKTATAQEADSTESADMAAFFDELMLDHMAERSVPGAAIVVVKDGQILFSQGYGYADVVAQTPVDPATTLFRIGSVSKLFTWTAVMQLVEQGKLDLDTDINTYLDFAIPDTYAEPITIRHLLSHTAGFEDRGYQTWATSAETLQSSGDWLRDHIPARIYPVGTQSAYSNYGATLAGYIVERVTGTTYDDYLEQAIFRPLGMADTSSRQPLPPALAANAATGYQVSEGSFTPQSFEFLNIAPAGAISAPSNDVARFMLAHLGNGRFADAQILSPATTEQMHSQLFTHDKRISGMAYGFFEIDRYGRRVLGHGGDTRFFHAQLALLPEEGVGFFAVCNSDTCTGFPQALFDAFMRQYYPETAVTLQPISETHAAEVAGLYHSNRTAETTAEKILQLVGITPFTAQPDGSLLVSDARLLETAPFVFQAVDGPATFIFDRDEQGAVTTAYLNGGPSALLPVQEWQKPVWHFSLLGGSLLLFLSLLLGQPLLALARRGRSPISRTPLANAAWWTLRGAVVLCLLLLALVVLAVLGGQEALLTGQIPLLRLWPILFGLIVALALAALVFTGLLWWQRMGSWGGRLHYTLVTLAVWGCIWFIHYWHLLKW